MKLYYSKCNHIPMSKLVSVIVSGNVGDLAFFWWVKYLPWVKLSKVWDTLFEEYTSLIEGDQSNISLSLVKDVNFMRNKIYIIEIAVYALRASYNSRAIALLKKLGYDFKYRPDTYLQDCDRVLTRSKTIVADLLRKSGELKKMQTNEKVVTEQDYIDMAWAISKAGGPRLSLREITASEFCAALNSYNKEVARVKEQATAAKVTKSGRR